MLGHLPSLGSPAEHHGDLAMESVRLLSSTYTRARHYYEALKQPSKVTDVDHVVDLLLHDVFLMGLYSGHIEAHIQSGGLPRGARVPGMTHRDNADGLVGSARTLVSQIRQIIARNAF